MAESVAAVEERAQRLRILHEPGRPLILCNVYDAATATIVSQNPISKVIATASYGVAAVQGIEDDDMSLKQNLNGIQAILRVVKESGKPVTVDLQDGYGHQLETAVESIIDLGAVGCNLEDFDRGTGRLYTIEEATDRVRRTLDTAARKGIRSFVLNARTDVLKVDGTIQDAIERGKAFLTAGATSVFVLGGSKRGGLPRNEIVRLVEALDGRVNVLMGIGPGYLTIPDLRQIGVARISVGPGLYRKAMETFSKASNSLLTA